jgi:HAMP domain-containing protein
MRAKIIVGNLIAILIVGLGAYALVKGPLEHAFLDEVDTRLADDYALLERSVQLNSRELLGLVTELAAERPLREVFAALDENGRRNRAFDQAERVATWLGDPARGRGGPPSFVAITDDAGRVVSRNADRNRMYGQDLRPLVPAVTRALAGAPVADVWEFEGESLVMLIAASPIRTEEGRVTGVLLVGYDLSNGLASQEAGRLHREVAFISGDRVYGSSMSENSDALRGFLFGDGSAATTAARDGGAVSGTFLVSLAGREYAGVVGPLSSTSGHVAMAVLGDRTAQLEKASPINYILMFMVLGLVLALAYGFFIGGTLLRPVEQMEETILNVINGRQDLRIQVESAEYGGLAYRINQLLNMFTGTPEADESGRLSSPPPGPAGGWDEGSGASGGGPPPAAAAAAGGGEEASDPAVVAKLAAEPEDAYYARVYQEYVAAKQAAGENVSNIPQDKFVQRLKSNEQALLKKHGCRMVRFEVQVKGNQVNLKPVIIP